MHPKHTDNVVESFIVKVISKPDETTISLHCMFSVWIKFAFSCTCVV